MQQHYTHLRFANYFTLFFFFTLFLSPSVSQAQISGKVFRDLDADGVYDASEYPESGIRVVAYNTNGDSITQVTTTATLDGSGDNYSFTGLTLPVRLEFRVTSYLFSAKGGVGNTTVQFYSAASSDADLAVHYPSLFCQNDPNVIIPCYVSGDPEGGGTGGSLDALVSFPYSTTGSTTSPTHIASASEIGTVWGSAYQRESKKLILAAFLKRHCGLEALGLGGLFLGDFTGAPGSIASYINIENFGIDLGSSLIATRAILPASATTTSADPLAFDYMGKIGMGSIDLSDDGKVLWGVNLYDKTIFSFQIGNPVKAAASVTNADFASFTIPDPGCTNGISRPWAIEYYEGKIYVGTICSGESGGTQSDMYAYIYRFDPTTNTWDASPVVSFALNYAKGDVHTSYPSVDKWETWANAFTDLHDNGTAGTPSATRKMRPQPILTDIQFDNRGNLIVGFSDRTGHQTGRNQLGTSGATLYNGYIGGDILYLKSDGVGGFTLESNGSVAGQTGSGVSNTQGPGNGEFFGGDFYDGVLMTGGPIVQIHQETMQGGLFYHPGRDEIMANHIDPFSVFSGGVMRHAVSNGYTHDTMRFQIYNTGTANGTFGKANGLGLLEMACDAAPLEVGNLVWNDTNGNGIQDPNEAGIDGVTVKLFKNGSEIASTTTAGGGKYGFSSATTGSVSGWTYNVAQLLPFMDYEIRILNFASQSPLSTLTLTAVDNGGSDANTDIRDSDGTLSTTNIIKAFTTDASGQNNHNYDFGFKPVPLCTQPTITSAVITSATCTNGTPSSNATIAIKGISGMEKYAYRTNTTDSLWAINATASTADSIKITGIANPSVSTTYTFRLWSSDTTCYNDTIVTVYPINCAPCTKTIMYLCGFNKYNDALSYDHGMIDYLRAKGHTVTPAQTSSGNLINPETGNPINTISTFDKILVSHSAYFDVRDNVAFLLDSLKATTSGVLMLTSAGHVDLGIGTADGFDHSSGNIWIENNASPILPTGLPNGVVAIYNDSTTLGLDNYSSIVGWCSGVGSGAIIGAYRTSQPDPRVSYVGYKKGTTLANNTTAPGNRFFLGYLVEGASIYQPQIQVTDPNNFFTAEAKLILDEALEQTCPCCTPPTITGVSADTATCTNGVANSDAAVHVTGITGMTSYVYGTNGTTGLYATNATASTASSIDITGLANPASATTYTFRIYAADSTCYNDTTVILNPSVCPQCSITGTFTQNACNDNGTPATGTDDHFTVTITAVSATNGGASGKYEVLLNGTTVLNTGGTAYGSPITVGGSGVFSADGSTTYQLTVRDLDKSTCTTNVFTTTATANCSSCPPQICVPVAVSRN